MPSMTPEEARELIETAKRISPRLDHDLPHLVDGKDIADMAETIAAMDYQEADYRPPRFYTVDEPTEKGPDLGRHVTRARRLTGPWEKA